MAPTRAKSIASLDELERGDVVRHKTSGATCIVDANYGKFVIGVTHQHISNPDEWELVVAGVMHKEKVEESKLIPAGSYTLKIASAEVRPSATGHERLVFKSTITDCESPWMREQIVGKTITHVFLLVRAGLTALQRFYITFGVTADSLPEAVAKANDVIGAPFKATVDVIDGKWNRVQDVRPATMQRGPYR